MADEKSTSTTLTERVLASALGVDGLEIHLAAAELQVGRYDPITHLTVFSPAEAERIAQRLGVPQPKFPEKDSERDEQVAERVPEPEEE